jgi:short subunit dehydrogenase-like uncharacterized protein
MTPPAQREFDLVLYGASGFVGRQTVAYLARHAAQHPRAKLRWALAGRNAAKLAEVAALAGVPDQALIVADAQYTAALGALAARSRVVLSSAGPFALYGSGLVAACVAAGTHYADITGETPWVRGLIDQHHAQAARRGTRIVPGCGFDSVPSDIGTWLLAQEALQRFGEPLVSVKAAFSMKGGLNGGTLASALNMYERGEDATFMQPFLLNPKGTVPARASEHDDPLSPVRDTDFAAWLGPFVMGPINTRVVRRSVGLLAGADPAYAASPSYQEFMRFGRGPAAAATAAAFASAMLSGRTTMKLGLVRRVAGMLVPKPGQGPSEAAMDGGRFRCELVGRTASGQVLRAVVADQGDPGNRATTKMVCESALALALNTDELPTLAGRGGVLTPATALGGVLVRRLREAGMTLEVKA